MCNILSKKSTQIFNFVLQRKKIIKIRLRPNITDTDKLSGWIELWYKYEWRSVGINHWTNDDAVVACRELGFNKGMCCVLNLLS